MQADRVISPEKREMLALALEEAAVRVRQSVPDIVEVVVEDDVERIIIGVRGETIPGVRSPRRRVFRIEW